MKIIKCENGHYFDNDAYPTCPLCGAAPAAAKSPEAEPEKKRGLFARKKAVPEAEAAQAQKQPYADEPMTVALPHNEVPARAEAVPAPSPAPAAAAEAPAPAPVPAAPAVVPPVNTAPSPAAAAVPAAPVIAGLQESLREASSTSEGKTLSYFSAMTKEKEEKPAPAQPAFPAPAAPPAPAQPAAVWPPQQHEYTAPAAASAALRVSSPSDPTVGWLITVAGPHLCETFPLSVGLNSIGRNAGNKLVLSKDQSVSREKHAFITYEPKTRQFFLRPGDSSGLTYLNGEYIFETKKLQAGDMVELGQSRFYFLPLCGDSFAWEDYLQ